ncbi:AhpC/TSA family protein [Pseudoalteromonas sp. SMS1]|uniref:peroxiredoxin-like family protein n=1 Tax=Pseudoalteromonas sp. SMS1 TaxID=2908894 RepID=UPI001F3F0E83|nr:peroxiredoxin-like family protein [Pseudoalteromonas sp. SMS1]MCF2856872.1 AhpC/TSA family protein [Pseudoalteromonas sp. SMS1]
MASLAQALSDFKHSYEQSAPPEILETLSRNISLLQEQRTLRASPKVSEPMPDGTLYDNSGQAISLTTLLQRPLIITFVRGGWCPYCMLELRAWEQLIAEQPSMPNLIAVSGETLSFTKQVQLDNALSFPLLLDPNFTVMEKFGLVYEINDALKAVLLKWGVDLLERTARTEFALPIPATYIVDTSGTVQYAFIEEDYTSRAEPMDVLAVYQQLLQAEK